MLDSVILLCAVLLFGIVSLIMTDVLPSLAVTILLAIGITAIFVGLYWFLFVFWIGVTPGERLARLECLESREGMEEEDQARFR